MVVSKSTLIQDIWRLFYDRIKAQVTTTTITGSITVNVQTYDSNYSDRPFTDSSYYPVIVINTPSVPTEYSTMGREKVMGTILCEVYTNQSESADKFTSQIINTIETYKGTLASNGLRRLRVQNVDSDMVMRGNIKIHIRRVTFSYLFYYDKTASF